MIRVAIICDTSGNDDEGMKKVARKLASAIDAHAHYRVSTISVLDSVRRCSEFDIFHFIGGPSYKTILAAYICKLVNRKSKTYLTFTNPFLSNLSIRILSWLQPTLCLVTSSSWFSTLHNLGVRARMFNVSGVDITKFSPVAESHKVGLRVKLNLPLDKLVVLHVGHLKQDRNLRVLLGVQEDPDFQVVVVGSTTTKQSADEIRPLLNAGCLVVQDYVPLIEEYYQAADCYIFPTVDPRAAIQIPLSILEALAVGIPVFSTNFGGLEDTVGNCGGAIHYVENGQLGDLGRIVKRALDKHIHMPQELEGFDWNRVALALVDLYEE